MLFVYCFISYYFAVVISQGANGAMSALFDRYNFSVLTYIHML